MIVGNFCKFALKLPLAKASHHRCAKLAVSCLFLHALYGLWSVDTGHAWLIDRISQQRLFLRQADGLRIPWDEAYPCLVRPRFDYPIDKLFNINVTPT